MNDLILDENITPRAILIGVDTGEFDAELSIEELSELAETAGAEPVLKSVQKRPACDSATCVGKGRLLEIKEAIENNEISLAIFDQELTANQTRNIEDILDIQVIDRTTLILDIFAQRARTKEGRIQVELAQNQYRLAHLAGKGVMLSRLGGGIGTRGPGESKLETDKRHIRRRIDTLKAELEKTEKRRTQHRQRRKKDGILAVAIVGYTNAGKSTLLNALTQAGVLAENKLFATLDPTSRMLDLPDGRSVMLIDTVGLIRRLPHQLIEAFKSTLEEAANADLILNLIDISTDDGMAQAEVTEGLLRELGCEDIPQIFALNKCDLLPEDISVPTDERTVLISARSGYGLDSLTECIARNLPATSARRKLIIPYDKTNLINEIRIDGKIFSEEYLPEGTLIDALVDVKLLYKTDEFIAE
jgi:GTP-binding protein HflX